MKYVVQVGEQRVDVELDARGITVNGRVVQAHLADVPGFCGDDMCIRTNV